MSLDSAAPPIPVLSLFSGAGGLDLGFERAGFAPQLALDIDKAAVETYNWNRRKTVARTADLSATPPELIADWWRERMGDSGPRGIIGGPPCQAFSVSNAHRLEDDPRAKLPLAYAAILGAFNSRWGLDFFLFENVSGLGRTTHIESLDLFKEQFAKAGFENVREFYLDAVDFGVPQFRRRMFLAGLRKDAGLTFVPPAGASTRRQTVRDTIGNLVQPQYHTRGGDPAKVGLHPNHWCMNPRSARFSNGTLQPGEMRGRSFRTLNWDEPSWTVAYGHREVHVHPCQTRRLSVYEAMLLQGFPTWYELRGTLTDQIRQVSDSVPPPLAEALAKELARLVADRPVTQVGRTGHVSQSGARGVHTPAARSSKA